MALTPNRVLDGVHKGKGNARVWQCNPKVPALEEADPMVIPLVTTTGCLQWVEFLIGKPKQATYPSTQPGT
jgi:hypothetical protein